MGNMCCPESRPGKKSASVVTKETPVAAGNNQDGDDTAGGKYKIIKMKTGPVTSDGGRIRRRKKLTHGREVADLYE